MGVGPLPASCIPPNKQVHSEALDVSTSLCTVAANGRYAPLAFHHISRVPEGHLDHHPIQMIKASKGLE